MSAKDNIVSFIKSCDLFGESFTFKIRKKKYYTSIVGGFTSLCFILYSLYYFSSAVAEFFSKSNRTIEKEINTQPLSKIKFTDHNYFTMAFCLRENTMWIDDYLSTNLIAKAYLVNNKMENNLLYSDKKEISFDKCNNDNLKSFFGDYSAIQQFEGCRCVNMTRDDVQLNTKYEIIDTEFIQVEFSHDTNANVTNEIKTYLENFQSSLSVYFPSFTFNTKDVIHPLQMTVHQEIYPLIPNWKYDSRISLSKLIFNDFSSLYDNENSHILSRLTFEDVQTTSYPARSSGADKNNIFNIQLGLSKKSVTFTSKVLLYDEFLGNFVGYLSNIIIILYCFNVIYNSFGARVYFAEKFFIKNRILESKIVNGLKEKFNSDRSHLVHKNHSVSYKLEKVCDSENYSNTNNSNINSGINHKNIFPINKEIFDAENNTKSKLDAENELSENIHDINNNYTDEFKVEENQNNSPVKNIINNQKLKRIQLIEEKEIITSKYSNNAKGDKNIEFNKIDSVKDNSNSPKKNKNRKNSYKFNFLEYFMNTMCCFRKNAKIDKKNVLLDNSEDFCDYYLDINTYVKKMIEIDLLKLYIIKNKDDLKAIENFQPALKTDYSDKYNKKVEKLYTNVVSKDLEDLTENIKKMKTTDERIYQEILSFYN